MTDIPSSLGPHVFHIVPLDRLDDYEAQKSQAKSSPPLESKSAAHGSSSHDALYLRTSSSILLTLDLYWPWLIGGLALYPHCDGTSYVVHVFMMWHSTMRHLHGKIIARSRFYCENDEDLPSRDLLMYHYQHCTIRMLRG